MTKVIIDSQQKMFYRRAGLEISAQENISNGAFYQIWISLQSNLTNDVLL